MIKNIERTRDGMDSLVDRTRDAVVGAAGRAERGVESAAEHLTARAHATGKYVREGASTVSQGAHQRLAGGAKVIDRGYVRTRTDLSRAASTANDYVTENPGKVLLFAASAGFLLGLLASGRACVEEQ